jgi:hypothetical protein
LTEDADKIGELGVTTTHIMVRKYGERLDDGSFEVIFTDREIVAHPAGVVWAYHDRANGITRLVWVDGMKWRAVTGEVPDGENDGGTTAP